MEGGCNVREDFLCEHLFEHPKIPKSEGIRTKKFKYFRYIDYTGNEELYNLELDPNEKNNLVNDISYNNIKNELREKLENYTKQIK